MDISKLLHRPEYKRLEEAAETRRYRKVMVLSGLPVVTPPDCGSAPRTHYGNDYRPDSAYRKRSSSSSRRWSIRNAACFSMSAALTSLKESPPAPSEGLPARLLLCLLPACLTSREGRAETRSAARKPDRQRNQFLSQSPAARSAFKKTVLEEILRRKQGAPGLQLARLERWLFRRPGGLTPLLF